MPDSTAQLVFAVVQEMRLAYERAVQAFRSGKNLEATAAYAETLPVRDQLRERLPADDQEKFEDLARDVFAAHLTWHTVDGHSLPAKEALAQLEKFLLPFCRLQQPNWGTGPS
jgi:hypothetical protein